MADVLVNLHGAEHRDRRRLENRLFRRETYERYEVGLFPPIIAETLRPRGPRRAVRTGGPRASADDEPGGADRRCRPPAAHGRRDPNLYSYLLVFIEGATLGHYTGDREAKARRGGRRAGAFDREFLAPSLARAQLRCSEAGDDLPHDVLSILAANEDSLHLPHDVVVREVAFYLLAGAHTSATAFTRVCTTSSPGSASTRRTPIVCAPTGFSCSAARTRPSGSSRRRRPGCVGPSPTSSSSPARAIPEGVEGGDRSDAGEPRHHGVRRRRRRFNPLPRARPIASPPYGLSFGMGMHACIGESLAAGLILRRHPARRGAPVRPGPDGRASMFDRDVRPDPDDPPEMDTTTARPYFGRYPVLLGA